MSSQRVELNRIKSNMRILSFLSLFLVSAIAAVVGQQCSVTESELLQAGKTIFFLGDREAFIPQDANQDMDTHCKKMLKNTDTVRTFGRCQQPIQKTLIGIFASGFRKEIKKSCGNKSWRQDFISSLQCLKKSGKMENAHKCIDKTSAALNYDYNSVPLKDQLVASCCIVLLATDCIKENVGKECGPKAGEFHANMFRNNLGEMFAFICGSMNTKAQCKKTFPKHMKEMENIFKSTKDFPKENIIGPLLTIAMAQTS